MCEITRENKAKEAVNSLLDSCKMLAGLSKGMKQQKEYDAYFVPETFWYNRVHLKGEQGSNIEELIGEISTKVRAGELPPLISWNNDDYDKKTMRRLLSGAGYVPIVTQTLMYMSLEGRVSKEVASQIDVIDPSEVRDWSQMSADGFKKPPETEGLVLLADHKDCDFFTWREDGAMVGGTLLICQDEHAGIHEVSTLEEYRRKGIGAALVNRALDKAVEKGCTYATLQASDMGCSVYEKLGMEDVGSLHTWLLPPNA